MTTIKIETQVDSDTTLAEMQGNDHYRLVLYVDWETGKAVVQDRPVSDTSWSTREHRNFADSFFLAGPMSKRDWENLVEEVQPVLDQVAALFNGSRWDGSNHVADWSDPETAFDLKYKIGEMLSDPSVLSDAPRGSLWNAEEWLQADPPAVVATATDDDLSAMAAEHQDIAHYEGVHLHNLDEYLADLRDQAQEEEQEAMPDMWDDAVAAGAQVYRIMECDGQEYVPGVPENRGNAETVRLSDGRWLYTDDVDGYQWLDQATVDDWCSGNYTTTMEPVKE